MNSRRIASQHLGTLLFLFFFLLAGCVDETEPVPLGTATVTLGVTVVEPVVERQDFKVRVNLTNHGPEDAMIDPLSFGSSGDSVYRYTVRGPNGSYDWDAPHVDRAGPPRGGADYPECRDLIRLPAGETTALEITILHDFGQFETETGSEYTIALAYQCECLKATWRGTHAASDTFVPVEEQEG